VPSGFAVEAIGVQVAPLSVEDSHLTIAPVWPVNVIVVDDPAQSVAKAAFADPGTVAGLMVTASV
jgi:hypothetical protein